MVTCFPMSNKFNVYSGFGLARVKEQGTTQIDIDMMRYVNVPNEFLESLGLRFGRRGWVPKKILYAFTDGIKIGAGAYKHIGEVQEGR